MSDFFEKIQKIAREQFGCTLVKKEQTLTFEEVFGFGLDDIQEFDVVSDNIEPKLTMYSPVPIQLRKSEMAEFEVDLEETYSSILAA